LAPACMAAKLVNAVMLALILVEVRLITAIMVGAVFNCPVALRVVS
jgi:hypothetical protein